MSSDSSSLRVARSNSASGATSGGTAEEEDRQGLETSEEEVAGDEGSNNQKDKPRPAEEADAVLAKAGAKVKLIRGGTVRLKNNNPILASLSALPTLETTKKEAPPVKDAGSASALTAEEIAEHTRQRGLALQEIVSTEKDYVNDLELLVKVSSFFLTAFCYHISYVLPLQTIHSTFFSLCVNC